MASQSLPWVESTHDAPPIGSIRSPRLQRSLPLGAEDFSGGQAQRWLPRGYPTRRRFLPIHGLGGQFRPKECLPREGSWARGDPQMWSSEDEREVPIFSQAGTGVPSRCGVTLGQECPPHPGDGNSPKWAESGLRSSWSRVSPGLGFHPRPRPHELNLGQKPPGRQRGAQPVSTPAGVSSSQNGAGCMCACLGLGVGGGCVRGGDSSLS